MWYIESMPRPYRSEWERHKPGYDDVHDAIEYADELLRNYALEQLAVRITRVTQD